MQKRSKPDLQSLYGTALPSRGVVPRRGELRRSAAELSHPWRQEIHKRSCRGDLLWSQRQRPLRASAGAAYSACKSHVILPSRALPSESPRLSSHFPKVHQSPASASITYDTCFPPKSPPRGRSAQGASRERARAGTSSETRTNARPLSISPGRAGRASCRL